MDTIVALSSGHLPSGVAVVRVSGPSANHLVLRCFGCLPPARIAAYGSIRSRNETLLDRGLVLVFPGPKSFTGEDCAEFHVHGGRAVVAALLQELSSYPGVRQAEPGEFTRRAFLNGKFDLSEAEALGDLIGAETEAQRRFALMGSARHQSALYEGWRQRLIHARAMIEAELDFSDEGDVPGSVSNTIWADMAGLVEEIDSHMAGFHRAEIIREGYQVVILGAPNAGKSSLVNALARRDVAIVSNEPGTTRDLIDVALDLRGVKVVFTDTAGLRENAGNVEAIGIERALARARAADLLLYLVDASGTEGGSDRFIDEVLSAEPFGSVLRVCSKADLLASRGSPAGVRKAGEDLAISVRTGDGLSELVEIVTNLAVAAAGSTSDLLPARERHVELLRQGVGHLRAAMKGGVGPLELLAEELRVAADCIGRIAGRIDVEDLLDAVFSHFCIGK